MEEAPESQQDVPEKAVKRAAKPRGAQTYAVQRGDTLSSIAARFGTTVDSKLSFPMMKLQYPTARSGRRRLRRENNRIASMWSSELSRGMWSLVTLLLLETVMSEMLMKCVRIKILHRA
jgi:hypothetical protein